MSAICSWCNLPMDDPADTVWDHIIPKSRGGPDKDWNLQRLHKRCNGPAGKGSTLTPEAEALAKEHGIVLREPLPTSWPGSNSMDEYGKPNPFRVDPKAPPRHNVIIRRVYEMECRTCGGVIGTERTYGDAVKAMNEHVAEMRCKPAA